MNQEILHCVQECTQCHQTCLETIQYCLVQGGEHAEPDQIRMLMDCAEICQTCINFMTRGSDLHMVICEACGEVCQQCFEACDRFVKDSQMKHCAEVCRHCAEACQQMAL